MNTQTPEPEAQMRITDWLKEHASRQHHDAANYIDGLERELTEARDALKFRRELYALQTGHLNDVRAQLSEEQRLNVKTLDERDRLAEALELLLCITCEMSKNDTKILSSKATIIDKKSGKQTMIKVIEALENADKALAAVKGGSDE